MYTLRKLLQRLLIAAHLYAVLPLLLGCWHEPFRTTIWNDTADSIHVVIQFDDQSLPPGHGPVEPGNHVNLTQRIESISYIEYRIGNHRCRVDKEGIAEAASAHERGVTNVMLRDCRDSMP